MHIRPKDPCFASGPTAKFLGYDQAKIKRPFLGRSLRSKQGVAWIQYLIERSRNVLGVPKDYKMGFIGGSDTGAFEAAIWALVGELPVNVIVNGAFSQKWAKDIKKLATYSKEIVTKSPDMPVFMHIPECDLVFTYNATTTGIRAAYGEFIENEREGIVLCDATSACFGMYLPWEKLDVVTYSFQKCLGGDAGTGAIIMSPRALERAKSFVPHRVVPELINLRDNSHKLKEGLFNGKAPNTLSEYGLAEYQYILDWAESVGGLDGLVLRTDANMAEMDKTVAKLPYLRYCVSEPAFRSPTSVCVEFCGDPHNGIEDKLGFSRQVASYLEQWSAAYDVNAYRTSGPGLRIWCGPTKEIEDVARLLPWIQQAYELTLKDFLNSKSKLT